MEFKVHLNDDEMAFLKQFAEKQKNGAKDNVGTMTPIHVVERTEKQFVQCEDGDVWIDEDDEYAEYRSLDALIEERKKQGSQLPYFHEVDLEWVDGTLVTNENEYVEAYNLNIYRGRHIISYRPVAFFFILDEAKRYKDGYQKHNCSDCRIYTYGLGYSNNGDLPVFRELLMKMGTALLGAENENTN